MSDLTVTLSANVSEFKRGMIDAQKQMKDSVSKMKEGWGDLTHTLKQVTVALTAVSGAVLAIVKTTANAGDAFQKLSIRTGASTEFLSEMAHAAELSDVSLGDMEVAFRKLAMTMGDANQGLATAKDAFDALGIEVNNTSENRLKTMEEIFPELVDAFDKIEDSTLKASLAVEIFGRSGTALIPLLAEGKDGIAAMREEAKALGLTWSKDATDAAAKFNDDLTRMQNGLKGIRNEIGQALFPILNEWIIAGTDKIKAFIANDLPGHIQKLKEVLPEVALKIKEFAIGVGEVVKWIFDHGDLVKTLLEIALAIKAIGLVVSTYKIALGLVGVAKAIGLMTTAGVAFMATPLGAIITAVAVAIGGVTLAIRLLSGEDVYGYLNNAATAMTKFGEATDETKTKLIDLQRVGANIGVMAKDTASQFFIGAEPSEQLSPKKAATSKPKAESTPFTSFRSDIMTDWTKESIRAMQTWQTSSTQSLNQMADSYSTFEQRYKNNMSAIVDNTLIVQQTLSKGFELDTNLFEEPISEIPSIIESVTLQGMDYWSAMIQQWEAENSEFISNFNQVANQLASTMSAYTNYELTLLDNSTKKKKINANKEASDRIVAVNKALAANKITESRAADQIAIIKENLATRLTQIEDNAAKKESDIRKKQKPFMIAQAIANTAVGVTKALAQGGIFGIVTGALVAAAGAIEVATISAQQFAKGGIVKFKSSGTDTVPVMATPGEAIVRNSVVNNYGVDAVNRFATRGDTSGLGGSPTYITIQTIDPESLDRYLRGNGRQPMIDFVNREKRMRTI